MSETETTGPLRGQLVFMDMNELVTRGVKATEVLLVGDTVTFDVNGFIVKATNTVGNRSDGFGTVLESVTGGVADGDEVAQVAVGNTYVYQVAGATIKPFKLVSVDSASKLVLLANPANAALNAIFDDTEAEAAIDLVRDYYGKAFGRYFYHAREEKTPTDASLNDVIVVRQGAD